MIPDGRLSSKDIVGQFVDSFYTANPFTSVTMGGVNLNDPSQGLLVKPWTLEYVIGSGDFVLSATGFSPTTIFNRPDVTHISLAFTANMTIVISFVQAGVSRLYWFDNTLPGYVFLEDIPGASWPCVELDDKRVLQVAAGVSDVILGYIKANTLHYRQQRDRYEVEYQLLQEGLPVNATRLFHIGMNLHNRFQFMHNGGTGGPPFLADVVFDLNLKGDVSPEAIDVRDLYNDTVPGLPVVINEGVDKPITWLQDIFLFDKSERDKKIFYPKRGRNVVARIPYKHLVDGNPENLKQTQKNETKLPRQVHINHIDPDGGFAKNKQTAQRRSNLVKAKGQETLDTKVVLTVDQAASAAWQKLKVHWNELYTYEFTTTLRYTELTVTDVVEVEDAKGNWHRVRLTERNEDSNNIAWEAEQDAGDLAYGAFMAGNSLPPETSTTPGIIGETQLEIINRSPSKDSEDEVGLYIAAAGSSSAWTGYQLLYSTDGGNTYQEAYQSTVAATLGETVTDLEEEVSYEYQADQTVEVLTNFPISSINYDSLLNNQNLICIGDEVLQYQTATLLGIVDGKYHYRLSTLVRARYGTQPEFWPQGSRFVLLDSAVIFVQMEQWMIGVDLAYKAVSLGHTADETITLMYLFDVALSQTEWPVAHVQAERDGSDNVSVSWVGTARLGVDTHPYHSKYFAGYRVKFSDDHTIDTMDETAEYQAAPGGLTVQVAALNSITGEGPYSSPVAV